MQVEENLPLFEYIAEQSKTDHPLILTGFDSQAPTESFITFVENWFAEVILWGYNYHIRKNDSSRPIRWNSTDL